MATQTGTFVNHGLDVITITDYADAAITNLADTNILLNSCDYEPTSEKMMVKNAAGNSVGIIVADPGAKCEIEVTPVGTTAANAVLAQTALLNQKDKFIKIAGSAKHPLLNDADWYVNDVKVKGSNTDFSKVSLSLEKKNSISSTANPA